jgi:ADP-dependent NAD(P)H-hydrate dehydratase / NAD(P)H-hydrate epimerase
VLSRNNKNAHKNDFGHVLVLAGSPSMLGAAALTGLAAMRTGAGLVTCGIPQELNLTLQKKLSPIIMTLPFPKGWSFSFLKEHLHKFDVIAIGPGMGKDKRTVQFILECITKIDKPMVIDADGLNALATKPDVLLKNKGIKVLTPHAGEMARLKGDPKVFAKKYQSIVLLKGHHTKVISPKGKTYINKTGNSGMATAGSGDVLTGMIAALIGQGIDAFEAAKLGAYLHGKAGDLVANKKTRAGLVSLDLIDYIPDALKVAVRGNS